MTGLENYIFYFLAAVSVVCALGVLIITNPIYSALFLVGTMISFAALFFMLGAYFVAGVQLIVYAGAVMVLFVMVVMLFDLKREKEAFSSGALGFLLKVAGGGALLGVLTAAFATFSPIIQDTATQTDADVMSATKQLAAHLFAKHVFAFEIVSVLLLLVIVGAVTLARSRGGTHV